MAVDDQLAALLVRQAGLYDVLEDRQNADILILGGTTDDPNSFDEHGGKTGPLGYYPITNVNGDVLFYPCLERMRALPLESVDAAITELGEATSQKFAEVDDHVGTAIAGFDGKASQLVSAEAPQGFSADQQALARSNIGAADEQALAAALPVIAQAKPQVSLLGSASGIALSEMADLVQIAGAMKAGVGVMDFVYDTAIDAAYVAANPYTSFRDKNGRGYRLTTTVVHARMFGVVERDGTKAVENADRIQAAIAWCARQVASGAANGYTISFEGMAPVYCGQIVLEQGVTLFGGRPGGRGGSRGCARLIPTGIPDNAFFIRTPGDRKIFHFGIDGFHILGGGENSLFSGILLDNASDGYIDRCQVNAFGLQCLRTTPSTGVIHGFKNFFQGLFNRAAITSPSGSVEIAGGDFFFTGCEISGPSQYTVSSSNLYCAALKCTGSEGTFLDCIMQTGDVGQSYLGARVRYVGCRWDTNAGHGMMLLAGDLCTFAGCSWARNGYSALGNGSDIVGAIAGNILTVTQLSRSPLSVGDTIIVSNGINCVITGYGTGTGGLGMYGVSVSQTVPSGSAMTGRTLYDHILVPSGGTAAGRCTFVAPVLADGSAGAPLRYCINDARDSANFRNTYLFPTGNAGLASFYRMAGFSSVTLPTGTLQRLSANSAMPSVSNLSSVLTANTAATAITNFVDGVPGQRLTILATDNFTSLVHGSGIALAQGVGSILLAIGSLPIEFIFNAGRWWQIGGDGTAALARMTPLERATYDFGPYDTVRASNILIGTDSNADGLSDGVVLRAYGANVGNQHTPIVAGGRQILDLTATGESQNGGRRIELTPALVTGRTYLVLIRLAGSTPNARYELLKDGSAFISNVLTDANGNGQAALRFTATSNTAAFAAGLPAFGGALNGSYRLSIRNILIYDLTAIDAATGYPATAQTDAALLSLFLGTIDRAPPLAIRLKDTVTGETRTISISNGQLVIA